MLRWWWCPLLLLALCPCIAFGQGRLEDVRTQASSSSGKSHKQSDSDDDSDSFLAQLLGALISGLEDAAGEDGDGDAGGGGLGYAVIFPFWLPYHLMDDDLSRFGYFPHYPYVVKEHFEIFGGYDFLRIGSVNLDGLMLGLRLWF